ncbi:hypothetical protein PGT21_004816 [Puccinia graminis f. sp. tritici]|uniref:FACT complex subunit n=1 Tax=Puccinia graminis f. sp. tritici TaxID=56615 RepID=A0A5B0M1S1_PUCGR|nr:hypothetical protein PGT21_004816 [Puccinia graminis f. sp. tritici]KAA1090159.1 hypothetical protein PGTUg99_036698 [Puccinia graminis f. sp. tritici]
MQAHGISEDKIDAELFYRRLEFLIAFWKALGQGTDDPGTDKLKSCGGIVLGEAHPYTKTRALQVFLCGRPLLSTLILITPYSASFLCSEDEAENLVSLVHLPQDRMNDKINVKVIVKPVKLAAANLAMEAFLTSIEEVTLKTGKKVGCLRDGEPIEDDFMNEWNDFLESSGKKSLFSKAPNISAGVSVFLASKQPQEIRHTEVACQMSRELMSAVRSDIITQIGSKEKTIRISGNLRDLIQRKHEEGSIWKGAKYKPDVDPTFGYLCYSPTIQAGSKYDGRKSSRTGADERLDASEIILVHLGTQYRSYNSDVSRTVMIEPHPSQEANYEFLLDLQKFAISIMKEGAGANLVYHAIKTKVAVDRPELESHLPKSFGSGLGVEFGDPFLSLKAKCTRVLKTNMIFSLSLSFTKLKDPMETDKTYSLQLTDTVLVGEEGSMVLSDLPKELSQITFFRHHPASKDLPQEQDGHSPARSFQQGDADNDGSIAGETIIPEGARSKRPRSFPEEADDTTKRQKVASSSSPPNHCDVNFRSTSPEKRAHEEEEDGDDRWPIFKQMGRFLNRLMHV